MSMMEAGKNMAVKSRKEPSDYERFLVISPFIFGLKELYLNLYQYFCYLIKEMIVKYGLILYGKI